MQELEEFKARVRGASDAELNALADAYQSTLAVLVAQARGVGALQEITLAEVKRRLEAKTSAAAVTASPVIVRGPYGCN